MQQGRVENLVANRPDSRCLTNSALLSSLTAVKAFRSLYKACAYVKAASGPGTVTVVTNRHDG
eukprot:8466-Eustigmatos_ZCMA.PRE.1